MLVNNSQRRRNLGRISPIGSSYTVAIGGKNDSIAYAYLESGYNVHFHI